MACPPKDGKRVGENQSENSTAEVLVHCVGRKATWFREVVQLSKRAVALALPTLAIQEPAAWLPRPNTPHSYPPQFSDSLHLPNNDPGFARQRAHSGNQRWQLDRPQELAVPSTQCNHVFTFLPLVTSGDRREGDPRARKRYAHHELPLDSHCRRRLGPVGPRRMWRRHDYEHRAEKTLDHGWRGGHGWRNRRRHDGWERNHDR